MAGGREVFTEAAGVGGGGGKGGGVSAHECVTILDLSQMLAMLWLRLPEHGLPSKWGFTSVSVRL